jgi:segregation and condensation protein B
MENDPAAREPESGYDPDSEPALVAATAADDGLEPSVVLAEQASAENAPAQPVQEELLPEAGEPAEPVVDRTDAQLRAILEAIIYITDEPLTAEQMAVALGEPRDRIKALLGELTEEFARPERGLSIQEIAGGYKMATKAEHHEAVRAFVRNLKPPLKLSLPALETLAVIAYKQPITAPEIMDIRGVQGAGVLKTLLDRKLIAAAGRKNVIGKPILYKTTREFLVQFGLKDVGELPSLKEFEELGRFAISDVDEPSLERPPAAPDEPQPEAQPEAQPEQA